MLTNQKKLLICICCAIMLTSCGQAAPQNANKAVQENVNKPVTEQGNANATPSLIAPDIETQLEGRRSEAQQVMPSIIE